MIPMSELFDELPEPQETWEQKALVFIKENPLVMVQFTQMARYWKHKGVKRGVKAIAEDYRYSPQGVYGNGKYKWNNNYTATVARYLMDTVPELKGYFELRHQSPKTRKVLA